MKEFTVFSSEVPPAGPSPTPACICWENLEQFARLQIQAFVQQLLEEEVTALVGREKSVRRELPEPPAAGEAPGPAPVYRNGYGKPRRLSTQSGTITLRRPRVRGLEERFESRLLPLFVWWRITIIRHPTGNTSAP